MRYQSLALHVAGREIAVVVQSNLANGDVHVKTDGPLTINLAGCDVSARIAQKGTSRVGCLSRRSLVIHLSKRLHGRRVRSARVTVAGGKARTVRGRRMATRVSLKGLKPGRFKVRIVSRLSNGRKVVQTRAYSTCARRRAATARSPWRASLWIKPRLPPRADR